MKIIYNNKEYGYQQPIINNIDVLLDVTNRTSGVTGTHNLSASIASYERLIISIWTDGNVGSSNYLLTNEVAVADVLADSDKVYPIVVTWGGNASGYIFVKFSSNTQATLNIGPGWYVGRLKIEGVKKAPYVHGGWTDITSACTFNVGLSSSTTKIRANDDFIAVYIHGNITINPNQPSLAVTLPSGFEVLSGAIAISTSTGSYAAPCLCTGTSSAMGQVTDSGSFNSLWWNGGSNAYCYRGGSGLLIRA